MRLIRGQAGRAAVPGGAVVTIGKFDGLHRGHRMLIAAAGREARRRRLPLVLLSFEPQPEEFFGGRLPRLSRFVTKWRLVEETGQVQIFACLRFDRNLARQKAEDFVHHVLVEGLQARGVVVGEGFRFGAERRGDIALLQRLGRVHGFTVKAVAPVVLAGSRVSSSRVRQALFAHRFDEVYRLLGRPYRLYGRVIRGDQIGKTLGFPTANMALGRRPPPLAGIYVVRVEGMPGGLRHGLANVGTRPTLGVKGRRLLEVYLPRWRGPLYGDLLGVDFLTHLRPETNFRGLSPLVDAMREDERRGARWLAEHNLAWGTPVAEGQEQRSQNA